MTDLRVWKQNCDQTFRKSKVLRFPTVYTGAEPHPTSYRLGVTLTSRLHLGSKAKQLALHLHANAGAGWTVTGRDSRWHPTHPPVNIVVGTLSATPILSSQADEWLLLTSNLRSFAIYTAVRLATRLASVNVRPETDGVRRKWRALRYLTSEVWNSTE
jgi:hypothetical protein